MPEELRLDQSPIAALRTLAALVVIAAPAAAQMRQPDQSPITATIRRFVALAAAPIPLEVM